MAPSSSTLYRRSRLLPQLSDISPTFSSAGSVGSAGSLTDPIFSPEITHMKYENLKSRSAHPATGCGRCDLPLHRDLRLRFASFSAFLPGRPLGSGPLESLTSTKSL